MILDIFVLVFVAQSYVVSRISHTMMMVCIIHFIDCITSTLRRTGCTNGCRRCRDGSVVDQTSLHDGRRRRWRGQVSLDAFFKCHEDLPAAPYPPYNESPRHLEAVG